MLTTTSLTSQLVADHQHALRSAAAERTARRSARRAGAGLTRRILGR